MYYKITNGSITLGANTILENIDFTIKDKEKIGIVGRNGTGKTTLLKGITKEYTIEDGYDKLQIESSNDFKIGYIKQNNIEDPNITMIDYLKKSYQELIDIENKLSKLEQQMSENYNEKILTTYNDLLSEYDYKGGYKYTKELEIAIKKFGFTDKDKNKLLKEFSGGQITKLSLIKLLLSKPDLLILDEPTNHLDINSIEWLEDYLKNYNKSIIVVSHDRMFLDNICNVIYEIEYGTLKRYPGNYTYYLKQKEEDYQKQLKDYLKQQKEIKRLQTIVDRFKYKPTKAKLAMSRLKQIEKMIIIDKPNTSNTKTFKTTFKSDITSYKEVLKVKNLSVGYDKELCKLSFNLDRGDKLGIIGDNGIGKSTLVKTLTGEIPALSGKYIFGDRVNIGYFSQQFENLQEENTIYEEIDKSYPNMTPNEIRSLLGSFEFTGEEVFKKIKDLSGGEKVRVSLCKILTSRPNVLILDEPTNHLDIINKDTIEKMLKDYTGTIIVVSHDRYLIKNVCNKLLVITKENTTLYNYGYQEYLEKSSNTNQTNIPKSIKNNNKDQTKLEKEIISLEDKVKKLNNDLLKEEVYTNITKSTEIQKEIEKLTKEINIKIEKWENMT